MGGERHGLPVPSLPQSPGWLSAPSPSAIATRFLGSSFFKKKIKVNPFCINSAFTQNALFFTMYSLSCLVVLLLSLLWVLSGEDRRERCIPCSPFCTVLPLGLSLCFPHTMLGVGFCSLYLCTGYTALAQADTAVQRAEPQTCPQPHLLFLLHTWHFITFQINLFILNSAAFPFPQFPLKPFIWGAASAIASHGHGDFLVSRVF